MLDFKPPIDCTLEEACKISKYLDWYYRVQDVYEYVEDEKWFTSMTEEEQIKFLECTASDAEYYVRHDWYWEDAVREAVKENSLNVDDDLEDD